MNYDALTADLPFELFEHEQGDCWKASTFEVVGYHEQTRRYMTAKTPVQAMALAIGRGLVDPKGGSIIDTQRGPGKNSAFYYTLEFADGLQAWCIGDRDALEDLLSGVSAMGAKTRLGHGALQPYEDGRFFRIVPDETAHVRWQHRNLPVRLHERLMPGAGALKPPYWRPTTHCWLPC